jgi:hypothetical protein
MNHYRFQKEALFSEPPFSLTIVVGGFGLEFPHDVGEDVANSWSEQSQNNNNDNGYQNENKRVLNQALAFFFRSE